MWIAAGAAALALASPAAAQTSPTTIAGKPLQTTSDGLGSLALTYGDRSVFYSDRSAGLVLEQGGKVTLPGDLSRAAVGAPVLSGTAGEAQDLRSSFRDGDLQVAEDDHYEWGTGSLLVTYTIKNLGAAAATFRAIEYGDAGSDDDLGTGAFRPGSLRYVGARESHEQVGLEEQPGSEWTGYEEGTFSDVGDHLASALRDEYMTRTDDDSVAAEWRVDALAPAEERSFSIAWRAGAAAPSVKAGVHADRDSGKCDPAGDCSLREALLHTEPGTVVYLEDGDYALDSALTVGHDVTIRGSGARTTQIAGSGSDRVFDVTGGTLDLAGVRVTGGDTGAADPQRAGGGIRVRSAGALALADATVTGNAAPAFGGGIYAEGAVALLRSALIDNHVNAVGDFAGDGGGLYAGFGSSAQLLDVTVSGNRAPGAGGGLAITGSARIVNTTITDNTGADGAGLFQRFTTFPRAFAAASVDVRNTIVAGNHGADCSVLPDALTSGYSLGGDQSCSFDGPHDAMGVDPRLLPLDRDAHSLAAGSPAIGAGDPLACPAVDQLGTERPDRCDAGALQSAYVTLAAPVIQTPKDGATVTGASFVMSGSAPPNSTLSIYDERGERVGGARVLDDGTWSTELQAGGEGTHTFTATASEGSSTSAPSAAVHVVVDLAPPPPAITFPAGDGTVSGPDVRLRGTAQAGALVTIYDGDSSSGEATANADSSGAWRISLTASQREHTYFATAADGGGESKRSAGRTVVVDLSDVTAPAVRIDAGPSGETASSSASFSFSSEPDATFECRLGGEFADCASPQAYSGLADGAYTFEVRALDARGNTSEAATRSFTVDTTPPAAPAVGGDASALSGTADPGSSVTVFDGGEPIGTVTAGSDGAWSLSLGALAPGDHTFTAVAQDAAGNRSAASPARTVHVSATTVPQPLPTPAPAPTPAPPVVGKTVDVAVQSGTVLVRLPGSGKYVKVPAGGQLPVGTIVDATKGRIRLTVADGKGGTQSADFYGGIFKIAQSKGAKPVTELALAGPKPSCPKGSASTAAKKPKTRKLWGSGTGSFRTRGQYSAATVRGTNWLTEDRCDGTLTRVVKGVVEVHDLVTRRTLVLRAGKHYLARPKHRR